MNTANATLLNVADATTLGEKALQKIGFTLDEARVITASLIDAELCGYPALEIGRAHV